MSTAPSFKTTMDFVYGEPKEMVPGVVRVVAPNPGPFTFKGTNTYLVGKTTLAVIDPGPDDPAHFDAVIRAIDGRLVSHILITHTHRDHTDLMRKLAAATGAKTAGFGRTRLPIPPALNSPTGESFIDLAFTPDVEMSDGAELSGPGWTLRAIFTPGHAPDHHCFELAGSRALFSGDHVMSWNTSVVAPPEGNMGDYYGSLERLIGGDYDVYMPGHGGRLPEPGRMVKAFLVHRRWREEAIFSVIKGGETTIDAVAAVVYRGLDPKLANAAKLSVQAHVEHLMHRGLVYADAPMSFSSRLTAA
jgi:glyoxylase-like metal-dependent hydrolase (beta-lactamase superfamily II)